MQIFEAQLLIPPFLLTAVLTDVKFEKVPNILILFGYITGFFVRISEDGTWGVITFAEYALRTVLLLYLLFLIRALGAGDIKLLSALSTMVLPEEMNRILLTTFAIGATISAVRIIREGQALERLSRLKAFAGNCVTERKLLSYETIHAPESYLHFTICIFAGYLITCFLNL